MFVPARDDAGRNEAEEANQAVKQRVRVYDRAQKGTIFE